MSLIAIQSWCHRKTCEPRPFGRSGFLESFACMSFIAQDCRCELRWEVLRCCRVDARSFISRFCMFDMSFWVLVCCVIHDSVHQRENQEKREESGFKEKTVFSDESSGRIVFVRVRFCSKELGWKGWSQTSLQVDFICLSVFWSFTCKGILTVKTGIWQQGLIYS